MLAKTAESLTSIESGFQKTFESEEEMLSYKISSGRIFFFSWKDIT